MTPLCCARRSLVDTLHHSNVANNMRTMLRLRELPARIIHAGHEPSFGRERLVALAGTYLENAEMQLRSARARNDRELKQATDSLPQTIPGANVETIFTALTR